MINNNNQNIKITLTKKQAQWLENTCEKAGITKSKYISWLLAKSAEEMLKVLRNNSNWGNYTDAEIQEIISTKWIE